MWHNPAWNPDYSAYGLRWIVIAPRFLNLQSIFLSLLAGKISLVFLQFSNGSLLPKCNISLQHMIYCNFTSDGGAASGPIHNTCIPFRGNYFIISIIRQYLECNFTLDFDSKIWLKHCKITNIFKSIVEILARI